MAEPVIVQRVPISVGAEAGKPARMTTIAVLAALLLSGCSTEAERGLCPSAAVLAPTAALTVFRNGAPADPSSELYTVWASNVTTDCDFDKSSNTTDSSLKISFHATRAPGADSASYQIPFFVTVTEAGDRILTKKLFTTRVSFAPGEASADFENTINSTVIKIGRSNKIGGYQILVGLQLTQEQLDYNKKMGHYAP